MFKSLCEMQKREFSNYILSAYNTGKNTKYLKIRSAQKKGQKANRKRRLDGAIKFPYIQLNSDYNYSWIIIDVDLPEGVPFHIEIFDEKNIPIPNIIIYNQKKINSAQILYRLKSPVWRQDKFRYNKPYKYYKAVYNALRDALGGDKHFSGVLSKNPLSRSHNTVMLRQDGYMLGELASHMDINWNDKNTTQPQKRKIALTEDEAIEEVFPGAPKGERNCSLFEFCRHIAYTKRRTFQGGEDEFVQWCIEFVVQMNENNQTPLPRKECECEGRSIGLWTWANIEPNKIGSKEYTDEGRARSLLVRRAKKNIKIQKVKQYLKSHPDASNRCIARELGYSLDCVNEYVRIIKARAEAWRKRQEHKAQESEQRREFLVDFDAKNERFVNQFVSAVGGIPVKGRWSG